jgi:hypothetical protein
MSLPWAYYGQAIVRRRNQNAPKEFILGGNWVGAKKHIFIKGDTDTYYESMLRGYFYGKATVSDT